MVSELGGPTTARLLLGASNAGEGFTAPWESGRLDLNVEALVLSAGFEVLFTSEEKQLAQHRLSDYGYSIQRR